MAPLSKSGIPLRYRGFESHPLRHFGYKNGLFLGTPPDLTNRIADILMTFTLSVPAHIVPLSLPLAALFKSERRFPESWQDAAICVQGESDVGAA